ncbi:hypothetical protein L810_4292 [Burkholderia sp. AU4i]|nr:hypothetical protein L810_4292 [Burkholderia sp. AU4i]
MFALVSHTVRLPGVTEFLEANFNVIAPHFSDTPAQAVRHS